MHILPKSNQAHGAGSTQLHLLVVPTHVRLQQIENGWAHIINEKKQRAETIHTVWTMHDACCSNIDGVTNVSREGRASIY